jgi:hypothetical protein
VEDGAFLPHVMSLEKKKLPKFRGPREEIGGAFFCFFHFLFLWTTAFVARLVLSF